jgi:hypothetical protein
MEEQVWGHERDSTKSDSCGAAEAQRTNLFNQIDVGLQLLRAIQVPSVHRVDVSV